VLHIVSVPVPLVIHQTKRMRYIIRSSVMCLAVAYIATLLYKARFSEKKELIQYEMCFDFLYKFCLIYFLFHEKFSEIL
jgi:hypothetical protein